MTDATDQDEAPIPPRRRFIARERLVELGVVIFGVLIALAFENLVQEVRWQSEARELEALFKDDITFNLAAATERRAVDRCLRQQLQLLHSRVVEARGTFAATPYVTTLDHPMRPVGAQAYRAPLRTWRTTSFDRALGTDAIKRIPRDRFLYYAGLFRVFEQLGGVQDQEFAAAADLAPLAVDHPDFNSEVRADVLRAIAAVDALRGRLALVSTQSIQIALAHGVAPNHSDVEIRGLGAGNDRRTLRQILEDQRRGRGDCVDVEGSLRLLVPAT
jgi:hypothetical protein